MTRRSEGTRGITLRLGWPPSVNHYWVHTRGRTFLGAKGKSYREAVFAEARAENVEPLTGRVGVRITVYPPDKRTRDLDNLLKGLMDACTHAKVWYDDSQVWMIHMVREDKVVPDGLVELCAWEIL